MLASCSREQLAQVPHHGYFNAALQKAKRSLKSFQGSTVDGDDDDDTESVCSGTTATTTEAPQWPKPSLPQSVAKAHSALLEEEGSPDPESEKGRKVIRKFINEWRPSQLLAILRYLQT